MNKIKISELQKHFPNPICWDGIPITIEYISTFIGDVSEIIEPFPYQWDIARMINHEKYTKEWHIGRIKYFLNHPEKIEPLTLMFKENSIEFYDGCHRFLAHVLRNDDECFYKVREVN